MYVNHCSTYLPKVWHSTTNTTEENLVDDFEKLQQEFLHQDSEKLPEKKYVVWSC